MCTQTWDVIDQEAEREAEALRRARQHRSAFLHHGLAATLNRRDQMDVERAVFDELLTPHFTHCTFCGKSLDPLEENAKGEPILDIVDSSGYFYILDGGDRCSIFTQDIDICDSCSFLHGVLIRSGTLSQPSPVAG